MSYVEAPAFPLGTDSGAKGLRTRLIIQTGTKNLQIYFLVLRRSLTPFLLLRSLWREDSVRTLYCGAVLSFYEREVFMLTGDNSGWLIDDIAEVMCFVNCFGVECAHSLCLKTSLK